MAGRESVNKQTRNGTARRCGVVMGGALGAFVAAAAMATGSAAPARADFEELLDPIIQPLLTSVTDSLSGFDPTVGADLTSWTDSLLSSLNSVDLALPSAAEPATASAASVVQAPTTADIPITMDESTEPTVQASIDGSPDQTLLVDTGSSGLVVPISDLDSGSNEFAELLALGLPTGISESGYSGGVDYIYLTYNNLPVDYDLGGGSTLDTTAPVEVEVYSWDPNDLSSLFSNDAFQNFLAGNDSPGGILGIGDNVSGGAGESPIEAAGYTGVEVDEPGGLLIASDSNPGTPYADLPSTGSTPTGDLTETITSGPDGTGTVIDPGGSVSDDLDSAGVYGTIPSSIAPNGVPDGDWVTVTDPTTNDVLYSYQVENSSLADNPPTVVTGNSIDSGYEAFQGNPVYIDYDNETLYFDGTPPS
ncbi:MAG: hypothetical protein QOD02_1953 [Mycobacterium sp.]|jgi:hypothetical protein|nr:hypothetical protein [Mycobacterium sp.]MDT5305606.1 hypothetical protein [Mycobacterium sp.]MDT5322284.1 hypothetical protein [Mycobacterium sp.]